MNSPSYQKFSMDLALKPQDVKIEFDCRTITHNDANALGELLWDADQSSVHYGNRPVEEATKEIHEILDGQSGSFLDRCSFVLLEKDVPICATLFTFYPKDNLPLLALTMTRTAYKNRGLCQNLLVLSHNALIKEGYKKCFLSVAHDNITAIRAYEKLGYKKRKYVSN